MKKYLTTLFTATSLALLLFAVACSKDDTATPDPSVDGITFQMDENPAEGMIIGSISYEGLTGNLTFNLEEESPAGSFNINSESGEISVADASHFDYESNTTLTATIGVADENEKNVSLPVTIILNDLDFGPIVTESQIEVSIDENPEVSAQVAVVKATTIEGSLKYSLKGSRDGFEIDENTGIITVSDYAYPMFDYETDTATNDGNGYDLVVEIKNEQEIAIVDVHVLMNDVTILWKGSEKEFTKLSNADWTLEVNQDRITDEVWITSKNDGELFNIALEDEYAGCVSISPAKTLWGFYPDGASELNEQAIADAEFYLLTELAGCFPSYIVNIPSILFLPEKDIFMNMMLTSWSDESEGGGFSYTRSTEN